jgi:hypothetical protein
VFLFLRFSPFFVPFFVSFWNACSIWCAKRSSRHYI